MLKKINYAAFGELCLLGSIRLGWLDHSCVHTFVNF